MKNDLFIGAILGFFFPLISYLLQEKLGLIFLDEKPFALYWIAIAINLVFLRVTYKKSVNRPILGNGVLLATFLSMLMLLYKII
ncbi:hypothetical protein ORI89_03490 [Sphingobacterium sp. UT-1RO-CII-1]|uniref:hypothetical protein n=1 Tax=Sphingobacterium sp. UT-1RO-CII-1 TaxID=2995225 RepID=UPI00227BDF28|nr:hypothetical protein [Sphingobacterium sp. UT-1RO-CII-1]MCY4778701.1 hypothetical protein [Sphingobacterium sp. UT-1RO-CII-1]